MISESLSKRSKPSLTLSVVLINIIEILKNKQMILNILKQRLFCIPVANKASKLYSTRFYQFFNRSITANHSFTNLLIRYNNKMSKNL